ncbi:hypothetical protein H2200_003271 [Cladophialophora chaetospira]|uniref:Peptidase metallopeptidase domain-containing protein n=1 Tax=Cladophialophora chaetospira TaxID=386627 RepID=A0AA38XHX1_9EURO|nr:hypothetical protein H2200_003271 [Cladophialophora chaetospira]
MSVTTSKPSSEDFEWSCKADALLSDTSLLQSNQIYRKDGPSRLALQRTAFWRPGRVLRVKFLDAASDRVKEKVMLNAKKWEAFANIGLKFVDSGDAEIRIAFDKTDGSWSYVGTQCERIPAGRPTMNFGWFDDNTRDDEFARTTIHEFGHALGCVHEHQTALSRLKWDTANKQKVYDYFLKNSGWSPQEVDAQVLNPTYSASDIEATAFDDKSIMLYAFPNDLFADKKGTSMNCELSDTDKEFIARVYPFPSRSVGRYMFNSANPNLNFRLMNFEPQHSKPPRIALGLSHAHLTGPHPRTVVLDSEAVTSDNFALSICAWAGTKLQSVGADWLEIEADDQDIQVDWPYSDDKKRQKRIVFPYPYTDPPLVIVWISAFWFPPYLGESHAIGLKGYTTDITASSFELHMDTWRGGGKSDFSGFASPLNYASLTWIACRRDKERICMGGASFDNSGLFRKAKSCNNARINFDPRCDSSHPPRVLIAVNALDIRYPMNPRFTAAATEITREGFQWNLDSGLDDQTIHGGGVSWIALAGRESSVGNTESFQADPSHWSEVLKKKAPSSLLF